MASKPTKRIEGDALKEHVRARLEELDRSPIDAAQKGDLGRDFIRDWLNDRKVSVGVGSLPGLAKGLDWTLSQLLGEVVNPPIKRNLSLKGKVAGGVWRETVESQENDDIPAPIAPDSRYPIDSQYVLEVEGNSVNKVAPNGSLLHCVDIMGAGIAIEENDLVVVQRQNGDLIETTVKRVRKVENKIELWPESTDPAHQTPIKYGAKGAEVSIKSVVIWVSVAIPRGGRS